MNIFRRATLWVALLPCLTSPALQAHDDDNDDGTAGAVYTMTNAVDGNKVLAFSRAGDGSLRSAGEYATGGLGSGNGLGNQNAVVLSKDGRWLFAVNAGSNQVSVFAVRRTGLSLVDTVDSGGIRPVSVTVDRDVVYVLNAGSDDIAGFQMNRRGELTPLSGSVRPLSGTGTAPAQIAFSPDGDLLVVTEKATNSIDVYVVGEDGLATGPSVHPSAGQTPFGFAFDRRGHLLVSEAAGGAFEASSVTSYTVTGDGGLQPISAAVPTTETAACWVVITGNGRYAYTTNAGSGSLAGYAVAREIQLRVEPFSVAELAQNVVQKFQLIAAEHGVWLYLRCATPLPRAAADIGLIERVLENCIGNALRHARCGGEVVLWLQRSGTQVEIGIRDDGDGIAPEDLPHIFDRFYRGAGQARGAGHAGLGLAIAQRIVQLHGGAIDVASRPGEGAEFRFSLPLWPPDVTPDRRETPAVGEHSFALSVRVNPQYGGIPS